jgi:V8-like Glu-specific endopeptidase
MSKNASVAHAGACQHTVIHHQTPGLRSIAQGLLRVLGVFASGAVLHLALAFSQCPDALAQASPWGVTGDAAQYRILQQLEPRINAQLDPAIRSDSVTQHLRSRPGRPAPDTLSPLPTIQTGPDISNLAMEYLRGQRNTSPSRDPEAKAGFALPGARGGACPYCAAVNEGIYGGYSGDGDSIRQSELGVWSSDPKNPCNKAASEFSLKGRKKGFKDDGSVPPSLAEEERLFRAQCFSKAPPQGLSLAEVERSVGVFVGPKGAFCAGFLSDGPTIITARHCFFSKADGSRLFDSKDIEFRLLGQLQTVGARLAEQNWKTQPGPIADGDDVLKVTLSSRPSNGATLPIVGPEIDVQLHIVGNYGYSSTRQWYDDVLWAAGNTCRIKYVSDNCVFHGCQTSPGFSGSPLLMKKPDGSVAVGAIHVGALSRKGKCRYTTEATQDRGNVGASILGRI